MEKRIWIIEGTGSYSVTVCFDRVVTEEEALALFNSRKFEDLLDEDVTYDTVKSVR